MFSKFVLKIDIWWQNSRVKSRPSCSENPLSILSPYNCSYFYWLEIPCCSIWNENRWLIAAVRMLFFRLPGGSTGTVGKKLHNNLPNFVKIILNMTLKFKDLTSIQDHKLRAFPFAFVLNFNIPPRLHCLKIRQILEDLLPHRLLVQA